MATTASRTKFFLGMGIAFVAVALAGFSSTFFIPVLRGTFRAPPVVYVHGALLFGWLALFTVQSSLIQGGGFATHRKMGWIGSAIAGAIVVSGVLVGFHATRRDLASGQDPFVLGQLVNILIEVLLFGALVAAAVLYRRDGAAHKRLLLLATISALGPAWLRLRHLLPGVPDPFVTFSLVADAVLLAAIARDWFATRSVHPVYLWAGGAMVAVHALELFAMTSTTWQQIARWLLRLPAA